MAVLTLHNKKCRYWKRGRVGIRILIKLIIEILLINMADKDKK